MEFNELNVAIDNATDEIIRIAIEQFMTEVWKMDWIRFGIDLQEEDNKYMYTATSGLLAANYFNYRHPMPKLSINKKICETFIEAVNSYGTCEGDWSDNWQAIKTKAKTLIKPPEYVKEPDDLNMNDINFFRGHQLFFGVINFFFISP